MELYYYEGSTRLGPVNPAQLRALADRGIVTPDTVVESGSKKILASKVKGLEFPPAAPPPVEPAAAVPPPVPPAAEPAPAPAEPPAPEVKTVYSPFGGGTRVQIDPEPAAADVPSPEKTQQELRFAAQDTLSACVALKVVGWFFYIGAAVSLFGGVIAALNTGNIAFVWFGLAGLAAGWASAQIPFALEKLGRFLLAWTRYRDGK